MHIPEDIPWWVVPGAVELLLVGLVEIQSLLESVSLGPPVLLLWVVLDVGGVVAGGRLVEIQDVGVLGGAEVEALFALAGEDLGGFQFGIDVEVVEVEFIRLVDIQERHVGIFLQNF